MSRRTYSDAERTQALELVAEHGIAHAFRETKVPKQTLSRWAKEAGIDTGRPAAKTKAACEANSATFAARRDALATGLLDDIERLRTQMFAPCVTHQAMTVGTGKGYSSVEIVDIHSDEPTFAEKKAIMTAVAIAVDKVQLLTGQATARHEFADPKIVAEQTVDELEDRRRRKHAA